MTKAEGDVIIVGGLAEVDAAMTVMRVAFDPAMGEAWTASQLGGLLSLPGVTLLLARRGDRATGFALARQAADEAELLLLAVHPEVRRQGIASRLIEQVEVIARAGGAARLFLEVRDGNDQAQHLYARAGFMTSGRRPNYYRGQNGVRADAITMTLSFFLSTPLSAAAEPSIE